MEFNLQNDTRPLYIGRENPHECIRCTDVFVRGLGSCDNAPQNLGGTMVYEIRLCRLCEAKWHEVYDTETARALLETNHP